MMIDIRDLKDINMIRKVTKDSFKDLGDLLNSRKQVPVFGYPLICYSPNENLNTMKLRELIQASRELKV
jgi:hypothetical protein